MTEEHAPEFITIAYDSIHFCKTVVNDSPELAVVFKQKQFDEIGKLLDDVVIYMEKLTTSIVEKIERKETC